jgi:hypothetical protein
MTGPRCGLPQRKLLWDVQGHEQSVVSMFSAVTVIQKSYEKWSNQGHQSRPGKKEMMIVKIFQFAGEKELGKKRSIREERQCMMGQ